MPAESAIRKPEAVGRAPLGDQVVYPNIHIDNAGQPLCGESRYLLHFEREPASLFWTMRLYATDGEADRCDSAMPWLARNADGSLTILIQRQRPVLAASNWLGSPEGAFTINMRFYGPHSSLLDGSWRIPLVVRAE